MFHFQWFWPRLSEILKAAPRRPRMSFRAALGLTAAAAAALVFAAGIGIFTKAALHGLELQELAGGVDKAETARRYLGERLPKTVADMVRDYAEWDPVYEMCTESAPDEEWLDEEIGWMTREVAVNGRPIARVALYDSGGRLAWAAGAKGPDVGPEAQAALRGDAPVNGLLSHGERVYLVAAHPVHMTGSGGPAAGALAFVQALEPGMVSEAESFLACKIGFAGMGSLAAAPAGADWRELPGGRAAFSPSGTVLASVRATDMRGADLGELLVERRSSLPALSGETLRAGLAASAFAAAGVLASCLLLAGLALRPVARVVRKLRDMEGRGALEPVGPVGGPAELSELAGAFDRAVAAATEARRREEEALERLANADPLTGLANRRRFVRCVREALSEAEAGGRPACVVFFDLNGLKAVNDQLGHAAGDARLAAFAEIVAAACDPGRGDLAARLGGDEYAVLVRASAGEAEALAEAVAGLCRARPLPGRELLGDAPAFEAAVACHPRDGRTPEALLEAADEAVKARKGGGAAGQVRRALAGLRADAYGEASAAARLLLMAADACDRYTLGRSERVAALAEAVARALGWGGDRAARLRLAGLLHDVGRAFLPPALLSKAGELSGEELREVRAHAERGAALLAMCPGLADVARWVRHHHERMDGSGYPDGLRGTEIPPEARVLAACDAYDAMTSPRLHRGAMRPAEAADRIASDPGFDPEVASALRSAIGLAG